MGRLRVGALLAVLWLAGTAGAIEIAEPPRWGFDGTVLLRRFNPLSIHLVNRSGDAFDGGVKLQRVGGVDIGEAIVEPLYLPPFGERWLQLYPLITEDRENFRLTFLSANGRPLGSTMLDEPKPGPPATMFLGPADRLGANLTGLKRLEEPLFPPMVTATDGLSAVVIAHAPQWDEPRQQAFLDWIRRGGVLHVLLDPRGKPPVFPGLLRPLNDPAVTSLGGGRIVRHSKTVGEVDERYLTASILEPAASVKGTYNTNAYTRWGSLDQGLLSHLKDMTRPDHNWGLIYFLCILYLGVFPAVYVLGRKRWHFGWVYGALILAVALFSLGFHTVGRRGYGESTTVHTIALARSLEPGQYDVTEWSHVFVTDGGTYRIAHKAAGVLYSAGPVSERVDGDVKNGAGAQFVVDIPPFSGRGVVSRIKAAGPKLSAKLLTKLPPRKAPPKPLAVPADQQGAGNQPTVVTEQGEVAMMPFSDDLQQLEVEFSGDMSVVPSTVYAVYRSGFYQLAGAGNGRWRLSGSGSPLNGAFQNNEFNNYSSYNYNYGYYDQRQVPPAQLFAGMERPVMQHALLTADRPELISTYWLPDDRVRLFFVADLPPTFAIDNAALGKQQGRVVYSFDVPGETEGGKASP